MGENSVTVSIKLRVYRTANEFRYRQSDSR